MAASSGAIPSWPAPSLLVQEQADFWVRMRGKQLYTLDHRLLLVIEEPILTRLKAGYDGMPCRRRML